MDPYWMHVKYDASVAINDDESLCDKNKEHHDRTSRPSTPASEGSITSRSLCCSHGALLRARYIEEEYVKPNTSSLSFERRNELDLLSYRPEENYNTSGAFESALQSLKLDAELLPPLNPMDLDALDINDVMFDFDF